MRGFIYFQCPKCGNRSPGVHPSTESKDVWCQHTGTRHEGKGMTNMKPMEKGSKDG